MTVGYFVLHTGWDAKQWKKKHKILLLLKICYLNLLSEIGQKGQSKVKESEILSTQSDI